MKISKKGPLKQFNWCFSSGKGSDILMFYACVAMMRANFVVNLKCFQ